MIRYTKQRDRHSCGPTAILNAMKWSGAKLSYRSYIDKLSWLCRRYNRKGIGNSEIDSALRFAGNLRRCDFAVRSVRRPTLAQIEEHLLGQGAVVLTYLWKGDNKAGRHVALVTGISSCRNVFWVVNGYRGKGPANWPTMRTEFKNHQLRFQRTDPRCQAWFLTKRGV